MHDGYKLLAFQSSDHRRLLSEYVAKMDKATADLIGSALTALRANDPRLHFKVISLGTKFGIHMGYDGTKFDVVAWIDPCLKWFNLRLRHGCRIDDIWQDVKHQARTSTPHTVVAARIDNAGAIPHVIEMVHRSSRL